MEDDEKIGFTPTTSALYYNQCDRYICDRGGEDARRAFESKGWEPDEVLFRYRRWRQANNGGGFLAFLEWVRTGEVVRNVGRTVCRPLPRRYSLSAEQMPLRRAMTLLKGFAQDADVMPVFGPHNMGPVEIVATYMVWCETRPDANFQMFVTLYERALHPLPEGMN